MNLTESINQFAARIFASPQLRGVIGGVLQISFTGPEPRVFRLDCRNSGELLFGEGAADCALEIQSERFADLIAGKLNPQALLERGEFRVVSGRERALRLGPIFS